jgi:hypothetical protein
MLTSYTFSCVHLFCLTLYEPILGGPRLIFFPLSVFSPPSSAGLTFLFYFYLCCIYLRSSYGHNRAVIIVEGGLRAVMMFAKTPPDEEQ